jgi:hypothetical protein
VTLRGRFLKTAAALVAAGLLPVALAAPAAATDYTYDGKDPISTGCANDAQTMALSHLHTADTSFWSKAYVELRYSATCHTAWARLSNAYGPIYASSSGGFAFIHRGTDGKQYSCSLTSQSDTSSCYTAMVYDKDPIRSRAYGEDDDWSYDGNVSAWTAWY